jgi:hypothetical protein
MDRESLRAKAHCFLETLEKELMSKTPPPRELRSECWWIALGSEG